MNERRRPFPTFVIWLLVLFVSLLVIILRLSSGLFAKEPPNITVTAEGQRMGWVVGKNTWNGVAYDRLDIFQIYSRDVMTPSQAAAGEEISIAIDGVLPDKATLAEYTLDADTRSAFGDSRLLSAEDFYFAKGRTGRFPLPSPGENPVRGYVLTCSWGENSCEYAFVVQILPE